MIRRALVLLVVALLAPLSDASAKPRELGLSATSRGDRVTVRVRAAARATCRLTVAAGRRRASFPAFRTSRRGRATLAWAVPADAPRGRWTASVRCRRAGTTSRRTRSLVRPRRGTGRGPFVEPSSGRLSGGAVLVAAGQGDEGRTCAPDTRGRSVCFTDNPLGRTGHTGEAGWYAVGRRPDLAGVVRGTPARWLEAARGRVPTGTAPVAGALAVWTSGGGGAGHVAYVTAVADGGATVVVDESNYRRFATVSYARRAPAAQISGYLYGGPAGQGPPADASATTTPAPQPPAPSDPTPGPTPPPAPRDLTWRLRNSNTGGAPDVTFAFGKSDEVALTGDWNGDGVDTVGVYRPATRTFLTRNTNSTGAADLTFAFGASGDVPVVGDWNGDGADTVGVYRPATSTFALRNSNSAGAADLTFTATFAAGGDKPVIGDWNGDGVDTVGLYRPSTSTFLLRNTNSAGGADLTFVFGVSGDLPVVGDWDGDGDTTAGVYRPSTSTFLLRNTNGPGAADLTFVFGAGGDSPLSGDWDGNGTSTAGTVRPA